MKHLDDNQLVGVAAGRGQASGTEHVRGCRVCGDRVEIWREVLAGLGELERNAPDESERHLLRTMIRTRGGARRRDDPVARLMRSTALAPAAVRGPAARLWEWSAGDLRLTLQAREESGGVRLLGQVTAAGEPSSAARLTAVGERGEVIVGDLDELGEFAVSVRPGRYRLEIEGPDHGLVVPLLDLGGAEG